MIAHSVSVIAVQAGAARAVGRAATRSRARGARVDRGGQPRHDGRAPPSARRDPRARRRGRARPGARTPTSSTTSSARSARRASRSRSCARATSSDVPASIDLSAYRIVQEALTNTVKHAGPTAARVLVRADGGWLEVAVTDDGARRDGSGRGAAVGDPERRARARRDAGAGGDVRRDVRGRPRRRRVLRSGAVPASNRGAATVSIRVALVDDQALVRSGFRMIVEGQPDMEVVAEAADGLEAVAEAERSRPDVVLMDIRMPHMDGIDATRRISEMDGVEARVLILTTYDLDEYVFRGLRAGASGFLLKDVSPEELVARDPGRGRGRVAVVPLDHAPPDRGVRPHAGSGRGGPRGARDANGSRTRGARPHRPRADERRDRRPPVPRAWPR